VAIPSLYNPANYGRYSVCFLSPGVSYPPVFTVQTHITTIQIVPYDAYGTDARNNNILSNFIVWTQLGDCQNSSKPFRPDLDRSKRCLNLVYLQNNLNFRQGGGTWRLNFRLSK
jgi:hypothetical protein